MRAVLKKRKPQRVSEMNVLITGGTGTLGVDTVLKFAEERFGVIIYSRRRRDLKIFEEMLDQRLFINFRLVS